MVCPMEVEDKVGLKAYQTMAVLETFRINLPAFLRDQSHYLTWIPLDEV